MAPDAQTASKNAQTAKKASKQRMLDQIRSLEDDDDERTQISKKISWILRHGARKVNIKTVEDGWVKVSDLMKVEILEEIPEQTIKQVIAESNAQKLRYELKESPDGQLIKAISKSDRKSISIGNAIGGPTAPAASSDHHALREDAPAFVPSQPLGAHMMMPPQLGYPWPYGAGFGFPPMMPGASPMMQWPGAYPYPFMPESGAAPSIAPGQFRGRIKSFNAEKGFGFIECAETQAQYGRDVFLHKAHMGAMTVGSEVRFIVETNKQGMPQAKSVTPLGGPVQGGGKGVGGKGGKGKGGGRGKGGKGRGDGGGGSKAARESNDVKEGTATTTEAADATEAS